jgi:hypothetical protein
VHESFAGKNALTPDDRGAQSDHPDPKDRFDLAEGMKDPTAEGDVILGVVLRLASAVRPSRTICSRCAFSRRWAFPLNTPERKVWKIAQAKMMVAMRLK